MEIWYHTQLQKCPTNISQSNSDSSSNKNPSSRQCQKRKDVSRLYCLSSLFSSSQGTILSRCFYNVIAPYSCQDSIYDSLGRRSHKVIIDDIAPKIQGKDVMHLARRNTTRKSTKPTHQEILPCLPPFHPHHTSTQRRCCVTTIFTPTTKIFSGRRRSCSVKSKRSNQHLITKFFLLQLLFATLSMDAVQAAATSQSTQIPKEANTDWKHDNLMSETKKYAKEDGVNDGINNMSSFDSLKYNVLSNYIWDKNETPSHNDSNTPRSVIKRSTNELSNGNLQKKKSNVRSKFKNNNNMNVIDREDIDIKMLNLSKTDAILPSAEKNSNLVSGMDITQVEGKENRNITFHTATKLLSKYKNNSSDANIHIIKRNETSKTPPVSVYHYSAPAMSRKNITICVILFFCVAVAIGINFINLSSDHEDLKDFYKGYMGRRLLIVEGRLTSKKHIQLLKAKEQIKIELGPQLNGSIMDEALTCQFYTPSPFIGANLIANGHLTNAQIGTEDTSEIFYEDGISFIPLRSWGREGPVNGSNRVHSASCKARGGLARQEAVDGKGHLIRSKRVISSNRPSTSLRTSINESSIETTGSATTGIITNLGIPQVRTPTTSLNKQQHVSSISHTIQASQNSPQNQGTWNTERVISHRTASVVTAGTIAKVSHGPSPSTTITTLAPLQKDEQP